MTPMKSFSMRGCHVINNRHGLFRFLFNGEEEDHSVFSNNEIEGNLVVDVEMRNVEEGKSIMEVASDEMCTFAWTGPNYVKHDQYKCKTCKLTGNLG